MKKPENIYQEQWYLFVNYDAFTLRQNDYQIPISFHNAGISYFVPEQNPQEFERVVMELWDDYCSDTGDWDYLDWMKLQQRYLYYIHFEDVDDMNKFQDLLDKLIEPHATMTIEEYNWLIEILPKFKEFKIPLYEEAEDSSAIQETTSQDSPEPAE